MRTPSAKFDVIFPLLGSMHTGSIEHVQDLSGQDKKLAL